MNIKKLLWWIKVWVKESFYNSFQFAVPPNLTIDQFIAICAIIGMIVISPILLLSLIIGFLSSPIRTACLLYKHPKEVKMVHGEFKG